MSRSIFALRTLRMTLPPLRKKIQVSQRASGNAKIARSAFYKQVA